MDISSEMDIIAEKYIVVKAIRKYGGSFMNSLADAMDHADSGNLKKIKDCWPDKWNEYLRIGKQLGNSNENE